MNTDAAPAKFKIVFLFTGQGSQFFGMGKDLFERHPVFREALTKCDTLLTPLMDRSLLDLLYSDDQTPSPLDQTRYTQPALFAIEYALSTLWRLAVL